MAVFDITWIILVIEGDIVDRELSGDGFDVRRGQVLGNWATSLILQIDFNRRRLLDNRWSLKGDSP